MSAFPATKLAVVSVPSFVLLLVFNVLMFPTEIFNGSVTPPPDEFIVVTPFSVVNVMFVPAERLLEISPFIMELLKIDILPVAADRYPADKTLIMPSLATISLHATIEAFAVLIDATEAFNSDACISSAIILLVFILIGENVVVVKFTRLAFVADKLSKEPFAAETVVVV